MLLIHDNDEERSLGEGKRRLNDRWRMPSHRPPIVQEAQLCGPEDPSANSVPPLPLRERVARMSGAKCAPGEGSASAETDPSPGMTELRSIMPPSPARGEGAPVARHVPISARGRSVARAAETIDLSRASSTS